MGEFYSQEYTRINDQQRSVLKKIFANNPYLKRDEQVKLSRYLGLMEQTVCNWFRKTREKMWKGKIPLPPKRKNIHVYVKCNGNSMTMLLSIIYCNVLLIQLCHRDH